MSSNSKFEAKLIQALASTDQLFLFDRQLVEAELIGYRRVLKLLFNTVARPVYELDARYATEPNLIKMLGSKRRVQISDTRQSNYRVLCELLELRRKGVICIQSMDDLPRETVQLIMHLVSFVRSKRLRWQFILFGKIANLDQLALTQLKPDIVYPNEIDRLAEQEEAVGVQGHDMPLVLKRIAMMACFLVLLLFFFEQWFSRSNMVSSLTAPSGLTQDGSVSPTRGGGVRRLLPEVDKLSDSSEFLQQQLAIKQAQAEQSASRNNELIAKSQALVDPDALIIAPPKRKASEVIAKALQGDLTNSDINKLGDLGRTALFYAAIDGDANTIESLLDAGADVDVQTSLGKTPLMAATYKHNLEAVKLLIQRGANINLQDHLGWTALFHAAWNNNEVLAKLLLKREAEYTSPDVHGYSASSIAVSKGNQTVASLLLVQATDWGQLQ